MTVPTPQDKARQRNVDIQTVFEQIADIPVPLATVRVAEQIVDIPVPLVRNRIEEQIVSGLAVHCRSRRGTATYGCDDASGGPGGVEIRSGWGRVDLVDGRVYCGNTHTRQTQWLPPGFAEQDGRDECEDKGTRRGGGSHVSPRRVCGHVSMGHVCPYGTRCTFAHGASELHPDARLV